MSDKDSAQDVIDSYRKKRQQSMPFLVGGLAIVLVAVGIVVQNLSPNLSDLKLGIPDTRLDNQVCFVKGI